jgi:phage FluMu protein Com
MPQKINCSNCGKMLYEGEILKSPQDVIKKFDGTCPNCKIKLKFNAENVKVIPHNE